MFKMLQKISNSILSIYQKILKKKVSRFPELFSTMITIRNGCFLLSTFVNLQTVQTTPIARHTSISFSHNASHLSQLEPSAPKESHAQGRQPMVPLVKWSSSHSSHCSPVYPGIQSHCPVSRSHSSGSDTPSPLQLHTSSSEETHTGLLRNFWQVK